MLARLELIRPLLACPRCRGALDGPVEALRCADPSCGDGQPFPSVGRWPVLVDFEHSILDRERILATRARTLVPRAQGFMRRVHQLLFDQESVDSPRMVRFRELVRRSDAPVILVIGGGTVGRVIEPYYQDDSAQVIAFDIYASENTQFIGDGHRIPLASGTVDAVIIVAVLEHVLEPWVVSEEIYRVLKPGGAVFAETPFLQHVHEGPYDFTRFTESGHRWLFRRFEHVDSGVIGGLGTQLAWSIDVFVRGLTRSMLAGKIARVLFYWLRFADSLMSERHSIDGASAVYFLGVKSSRAIAPREMVPYYQGAQR